MRAGLTAGAALALVAARDGTQSGNLRVFDAAWHAVARDYWDPGLHGIDWPALQARYRPLAGAAPDAAALYAVLDELLGAVGDSHVFAVPPGEVRAERADHHASVTARWLERGVLLIAVDGFEAHEDRAIAAALATHPRAVILDLRDNDGGTEDVAARTAGLFFAHPRPLLIRYDRRGAHPVPIRGAGAASFAGRLAVLVGRGSMSAAEALAALFAESGRAVIIGTRTAGALTGAAIERLPDGGRLSVAVDDVRTPAGDRIEGRGFVPALVVPPGDATVAAALRALDEGRRSGPVR